MPMAMLLVVMSQLSSVGYFRMAEKRVRRRMLGVMLGDLGSGPDPAKWVLSVPGF